MKQIRRRLQQRLLIVESRSAEVKSTGDTFQVYLASDGREYTCWNDALREFIQTGSEYQITYTENPRGDRVYLNVVDAALLDSAPDKTALDDIPDGLDDFAEPDGMPVSKTAEPLTDPWVSPPRYTTARSIHCDVAFKGAVELVGGPSETIPLDDIAVVVLELTRTLAEGLEDIKRGQ